MKILFLSPQPFFEVRGTPINVKLVVTALGELGHKVDLLTYPHGDTPTIPGVTIKRIPGSFLPKAPIGPSRIKVVFDAIMLLHALHLAFWNKYDAVHAVEESVFIAWIIKKLFGLPYVFDMDSHMSDQLRYSRFIKDGKIVRFIEKMENGAMRGAARIITVCQYLTDVASRVVPADKIEQIEDIPMQTDPPPEGVTAQKLRGDYEIPPHCPVILYTGNLEKYQGIDLLMESIPIITKEIPDARFVIVGGDEESVTRYKVIARTMGIGDNAVFTGLKPPSLISVFMDMADILLSPRLEGTNTPLKIYTYLESGKPIVATGLPTHTQVLTDDVAILAKPKKMEYASGILLLLKDTALGQKIGENGRKLVDENYNYEVFKSKVESAYRGLLISS
ncbi:hypothetical protein MNBD_NITROSPINAE02-1595 [hydrothermal vent metagenome]|uniref:Glycosyltransferase n=1 Tax=hydrothermal vent metagenome TaxID=652676 RepID=A0A3B1BJK7_9ZZZZ